MSKTNNTRIQILPSILSADFRFLEREVKAAQDAGADRIHCDVMDGHFVPNITFGPLVIEAVRRCVTIPLDVHLMISDPAHYLDDFCNAGASVLIVHAEVCSDLPAILARIRKHGARPGVSVNPDKPLSLFTNHLALIDQVLLMTVFAGFGGQKFIQESLAKIAGLHALARTRNPDLDIEVDGGINDQTAYDVARNGANLLVAGS
ncbi:MAG: ribulose-phosphate 3-epimerase, partial [Chitinispirillaceae bacterium]|nr:ribulose-phosphate 3-epimerase [Chitinispirillaceae bacterium]